MAERETAEPQREKGRYLALVPTLAPSSCLGGAEIVPLSYGLRSLLCAGEAAEARQGDKRADTSERAAGMGAGSLRDSIHQLFSI